MNWNQILHWITDEVALQAYLQDMSTAILLVVILAVLFQCIIFGLSVYQAVAAENQPDRLALAGSMILAAMGFSVWSILALAVKRLHDLNHPAPLVIMLFFPGVNWLLILYLMARPSYARSNEHGLPPQGSRGTPDERFRG